MTAGMSGILLAQNADPDQSSASVNQNYSNSNNNNSMMSQAQQALKQQGLYTGDVDAIYDPQDKDGHPALRAVEQPEPVGAGWTGKTTVWA
jgi:hypothetical protein